MMDPLISIVVPVYNVEKYLYRCYESLKEQTYKNIEIIFIDDGSPDNCGEICDKFADSDSRVKVVHKKNEGLGMARNSGLDIAKGKYVAFVDSDDFVKKEYIKRMYEAIKKNDADTVICGIIRYFNSSKQITKPICKEELVVGKGDIITDVLLNMISTTPEEKIESKIPISVWHGLYSMECIRKNNIRFHSEKEFISEDAIFQIDYLSKSKKVVLIPDVLYYYFSSQEESLSTKYRVNRFEEEKKLIVEIERKLLKLIPETKYKLYTQRMFLGRVRTCLIMEFNNKNNKRFKSIISDSMVQEVVSNYPYGKNPIKLKLFNFFLNKKNSFMLKFLIKLRG